MNATDWTTISYTYDPAGRRIAKSYDGTVVARYLYDGPQTIAEYDGNNRLLRKYVHGPAVDQPICMIDRIDPNLALSPSNGQTSYYYHYDGLGSVVGLSDAAGEAAVLYEYGIYGQAAASDPNHPNPFLFTGREFDKETGLYYYRARYYNATIGRFLQTDPVGYGPDINLYRYCVNGPLNWTDPYGLDPCDYICDPCDLCDPCDPCDLLDPSDPCDLSDPCDPSDSLDPPDWPPYIPIPEDPPSPRFPPDFIGPAPMPVRSPIEAPSPTPSRPGRRSRAGIGGAALPIAIIADGATPVMEIGAAIGAGYIIARDVVVPGITRFIEGRQAHRRENREIIERARRRGIELTRGERRRIHDRLGKGGHRRHTPEEIDDAIDEIVGP